MRLAFTKPGRSLVLGVSVTELMSGLLGVSRRDSTASSDSLRSPSITEVVLSRNCMVGGLKVDVGVFWPRS